MIDILNAKHEKVIAIGEELVASNPFRFKKLESQYRRVSDYALKTFIANHSLTYKPNLKYYFGFNTKKQFASLIDDALITTGFIYSDEASAASLLAQKHKLVYLSPVSPLDEIYHGAYSKGLGFKASNHPSMLKKAFDNKEFFSSDREVILVCPQSNVVNLVHAENFKKSFKIDREFNYFEPTPDFKELKFLKSKVTLLMAGYGFEHIDAIKSLVQKHPHIDFTFIGTHQWSYCTDVMRRTLGSTEANIHIVSEFVEGLEDSVYLDPEVVRHRKEFHKEFEIAHNKNTLDPIEYAIFDSILMSLILLNDRGVKTAADVAKKLEHFTFKGALGEYIFVNGQVQKPVYVSKWIKESFVPQRKIH